MAASNPQGTVIGKNEYKVILIGAVGVGKTSLLVRYVYNSFEEAAPNNKVISEEKKPITIGGQEIVLDLWDTAGQERYQSITQRFYHSTCAVVIVFDVTDGNSYEEATQNWLKETTNYLNLDRPGAPDIPVILVGNKIDEDEERVISMKELKQFKKGRPSLMVAECSAKTGAKVDHVFELVAKEILKRDINPKKSSNGGDISPNSSVYVRPVTKGCC